MPIEEKRELLPQKEEFQWLDRVSDFLDSKYRIPFTNIKFGADFVIGLIPTVGDFFSFALSGTLVVAMARHGVSAGVLLKMIGNLILDTLVGAIPILGDIFDLTYRANRRNFDLLQKHYDKDKKSNSVTAVVIVIAILIVIFVLIGWLLWRILSFIGGLL